MNSERIEAAPGARELACDLLATYTGNDSLRTTTDNDDLEITSVKLISESDQDYCTGKAHYITVYPDRKNGSSNRENSEFCLRTHENGTYDLSHLGQNHAFDKKEIKSGRIVETSVEPVIRAHTENLVGILTDQQVKLKARVTYTGVNDRTFIRCLLMPSNPINPQDPPDYSKYGFYYDELGDGTFEIYHGINTGLDVPKCEGRPFIEGLVSDFTSRNIGYSCKIKINDPDLICESMGVDSLIEINEKVLLDRLLEHEDISESVISRLDIENLRVGCYTIEMNVVADVEDHRAFIALARDKYQKQWSCKDWYPDSMAEALGEITLLSNSKPAPLDMGYEVFTIEKPDLAVDKPEHGMMSNAEPSAVSDTDAPEL